MQHAARNEEQSTLKTFFCEPQKVLDKSIYAASKRYMIHAPSLLLTIALWPPKA